MRRVARQFFYYYGVFATIVTIVLVVVFGILRFVERGAEAEGKVYAVGAFDALSSHWLAEGADKDTYPAFANAAADQQLAAALARLGAKLGKRVAFQGCEGGVQVFIGLGEAQRGVTGNYVCTGRFENGNASVQLQIARPADKWVLNRFEVTSAALKTE